MEDLGGALSMEFTRRTDPVVDRTGLPDKYNFQLELPAPNYHTPMAPDGSPI